MSPHQTYPAHSSKIIAFWQTLLLTSSLCLTSSGQTAPLPPLVPVPLTGVSKLWSGGGGGNDHSCVLMTNDGLKCWGRNLYGILGDNSTIDKWTPVDVTGLTNGVVAIALGGRHSCALTTNGGVKCWGRNDAGNLGDNSTIDKWTPVDVTGLTNGVAAIALGGDHSCALTTSGGVKCWGDNLFAQLGDNNPYNKSTLTPVDVTGLTNGVATIALGGIHTCALTTSGGVKCWGHNSNSQLGDKSILDKWTPVDVTGLTNGVAAIALGGNHSCALTTSGGVKCWGSNSVGELGDNSTINKWTPVDVTGLTNGVVAIALGGGHSCALTTSGGVKCWGDNRYGQLGDNSTIDKWTPVDVTGLTNGVVAIALGGCHSCALTTSGGVKCWGFNDAGQLGDNSTIDKWFPVDVLNFLDLPDLEVQGNAIPIPSGHTTPNLSEGTDFGQVRIETQGNRIFILHNSGGGTLNLLASSTISCSGGITPSSNLTGVSIGPLNSYPLSISLTPHAISSETCTVTLFNDDPDENPYTFTLKIQGVDQSSPNTPGTVNCTITPDDPSCRVLPLPSSPTLPSALTLWASVEGGGEGKVTSQEGSIDCTKTTGPCQATYPTGTTVTLIPTAAPGSYFSSWGGNEECADGQIRLWSSVQCTAYFHANTPPTAKITVAIPVQVNQPVNFSGSFTDPETFDTHTFTWDFGDHNTAQTQNPSHTYTQAGTYPVTLTVTDNQGGVGADQIMLEVKPVMGWIPFDPARPTPQLAPEFKTPSSTARELIVEITTPGIEVNETSLDNQPCHMIKLPNSGEITKVGKPQLPMVSRFLGVPKTSQVSVEVLDSISRSLSGYTVCPAQEPLPDIKDAPLPPFAKDEVFYQQDQFYPTEKVKLDEVGSVIRGTPIAILRAFPVQFNPATKTLRVYTYLKVKITFQGGQGDFMDSRLESPVFDKIFDRLLLNASTTRSSGMDAAYDSGNSLLIITHPNFLSAAQTLAAWKIKTGITTQVKTTTDTGTTASAIRDYIQKAYQTWSPPPTYVLLIGDAEFIPTHYITEHPYHKTKIGTDLYYTTLDGSDYLPDIYFGRLSIDTLAQATKRVGDIINYEKGTITENSYYGKVTLAAYFQDDDFDDRTDRRFTQTAEDLAIYLSDPNYLGKYSVDRIYYAESSIVPQFWDQNFFGGGPTGNLGGPLPDYLRKPGFAWEGDATDISNAIEQGSFLVVHRDHGYHFGWGDPFYNTTDVQALNNGNRLPIVWSINCMTGWFDNETDEQKDDTSNNALHFSETWERNPNGGAVGIIAATRVSYSGYNDRLTWGLTDAIWPSFLSTYTSTKVPEPAWEMGAVLNYGKDYLMTQYENNGDLTKLTFEIFHWFGDPTMQIWTEVPKNLEVRYEQNIPIGTTSVQVTVNQPHALITLSKKDSPYGEILKKTFSPASGPTSISLPQPLKSGEEIEVVVTKHNYRPYEGKITSGLSGYCNAPTIRTARLFGDWEDPDTWTPKRVPNKDDSVLIQNDTTSSSEVRVNSKNIEVQTLCITSNVAHLIANNYLHIRAKNIFNQGRIQGGNGKNGYCKDGNLIENYVHATSGTGISLEADDFVNEKEGIIGGGTGGYDITHNCLIEKYIEARGGDGGSVSVKAKSITNNGIIGSVPGMQPTYSASPDGSNNGGVGSNSFRVIQNCPGSIGGKLETLGNPGYNSGPAYGGKGGNTSVIASERLFNGSTGKIGSGYGGDARTWSCGYGVSPGQGGTNTVTAPVLINNGAMGAGGNGKGIAEPEIMLAGPDMRFEDSKEIVLFGGDQWKLNLKNLSHDAITSKESIILAVGQGGIVDLRENNARIMKTGNRVDIFSDTILLDEGVTLQDLISAPQIETHPSKILYEVTIAAPRTIMGEPQTTLPLKLSVINSGPSVDTYTLALTNSSGWPLSSLPQVVTVEGLQQVDLPLEVTLPETLGATENITVMATSQSDPQVSATTEIDVLVKSLSNLERVKASGKVLNDQGQPLAGTTVQIEEKVVATDETGYWEIPNLAKDHYTVMISKGDQTWMEEEVIEGYPIEMIFQPTESSPIIGNEGHPSNGESLLFEGTSSLPQSVHINETPLKLMEDILPSFNAPITLCPPTGTINFLCDNHGQVLTNATFGPSAIVSGGSLAGILSNQGFISQVTLQPDAILTGGTLSGYISNQGTLIDITFVGAILQGGTLAGTTLNESQVGGTLIDVTFAPHARLKGGKLQSQIRGDQEAPVLLENVKVLKGSTLSGVKLGQGVLLEEGVKIE